MSSSRDTILGRVRGALAPLSQRAAYPTYSDTVASLEGAAEAAGLWTTFKLRMELVDGLAFDGPGDLVAWLRGQDLLRGYCDPELWAQIGPLFEEPFHVERIFDSARIDSYGFGITRAAGAIAETGSVILEDATTSTRLGALAPWVHIACFRRSELVSDVAAAVARLGLDPNVIWCTGPSKTADVEGILIRGVHGPGIQVAVLIG